MTGSDDSGHRDRVVVIGLIVVGVIAAIVSVGTWRARETGAPPANNDRKQNDVAEANRALERLQDQYAYANVHKQVERVIPLAEEQIARYRSHQASHNFLGMLLSEVGHFEDAYHRLQISLELNPRQSKVHFSCGVLATKLDRLEPALEHYRQAVSIDRDKPIYLVHEAMVLIKIRQFNAARMQLLKALNMDSNLADGYYGLAELDFVENHLSMALQKIDKAIERMPISQRDKQVKFLRKKAWILQRANRQADALATLRKLTPQERHDPQVIERMAVSLHQLGKTEDAAALYEHALNADPVVAAYAAGAARWSIKAGLLEDARRHLDSLSLIDPNGKAISDLEARLRKQISDERKGAASVVASE